MWKIVIGAFSGDFGAVGSDTADVVGSFISIGDIFDDFGDGLGTAGSAEELTGDNLGTIVNIVGAIIGLSSIGSCFGCICGSQFVIGCDLDYLGYCY